jgi:hypothetical protein
MPYTIKMNYILFRNKVNAFSFKFDCIFLLRPKFMYFAMRRVLCFYYALMFNSSNRKYSHLPIAQGSSIANLSQVSV